MSGSRYWKEGVMLLASSSYQKKATYFRGVWNSGHLDVILTIVVGIVRKGFCRSADGHGPEQAAFCSEAPDEGALIQCRGWVVLLIRRRKSQRMVSKSYRGNELDRADCCDMLRLYGSCSSRNLPRRQGVPGPPERFPPLESGRRTQRHPTT